PVGAGPLPPNTPLRRGIEWLIIVVVALTVAFVVKTFVLQAFFIPTGSMEPTLMINDRILVDKLSYDMHAVHRGDIVVFTNPMSGEPQIKDLVKRVIGLPGETISSNAAGQVVINGHPLRESYLVKGIAPGPPIHTQTIKAGYVFMMGDNRSDSEDSRYFGQVRESTIVGRVVVRVWPLGRFHFF
ncbi:MAG TPA: signal peptidase I, partial [Acidimicrobiales bacterium]|nr:signal peptidase I [Acidimicrobiales bacterium]